MKKVSSSLVVILAMLMLFPAGSLASATGWEDETFTLYRSDLEFPLDKQKHLVAGMAAYGVAELMGQERGVLLAGILGIGKEVYDHFYGGTVDSKDAIATLLGGVLLAIGFGS